MRTYASYFLEDGSIYIANPDGSEIYVDCDCREWYAPPRQEQMPALGTEVESDPNGVSDMEIDE